jgi:hypothetical protein
MPRNKYNNARVTLDGYTFDSKAEARRYGELKLMHEAGEIHKLRVHPRYTLLDPFEVKGIRYRGIVYEGDFEYVVNGLVVCEDVKGVRTAVFSLKEKLFMDRYGDQIELRVVEA